jgi:hypothetical protein
MVIEYLPPHDYCTSVGLWIKISITFVIAWFYQNRRRRYRNETV